MLSTPKQNQNFTPSARKINFFTRSRRKCQSTKSVEMIKLQKSFQTNTQKGTYIKKRDFIQDLYVKEETKNVLENIFTEEKIKNITEKVKSNLKSIENSDIPKSAKISILEGIKETLLTNLRSVKTIVEQKEERKRRILRKERMKIFKNINGKEFMKSQQQRFDFFLLFQEKYKNLLTRSNSMPQFINIRGETTEEQTSLIDYESFKKECLLISGIIKDFGNVKEFLELMIEENREEIEMIQNKIKELNFCKENSEKELLEYKKRTGFLKKKSISSLSRKEYNFSLSTMASISIPNENTMFPRYIHSPKPSHINLEFE